MVYIIVEYSLSRTNRGITPIAKDLIEKIIQDYDKCKKERKMILFTSNIYCCDIATNDIVTDVVTKVVQVAKALTVEVEIIANKRRRPSVSWSSIKRADKLQQTQKTLYL